MADSEAPRERPKLNLKPRDPEAARLAELERQKGLSKNPFGDAKPREAVLSEKLGKPEEEILKEEAKKQRPHLRLSPEQISQKKEKEAAVAEVDTQVTSEEDPKKKELLLTELASRKDELDELLDGFEKLALEKAAKGEVARPSERRATLEQQQPARAAAAAGGFGNGFGQRDEYSRGGHGGGRGGHRGDYDYNGRGGGGFGGGRGGYQRQERDSFGSRDNYNSYGKDEFGSGYGGSRGGGGYSGGGGFGGSYGSGGYDKPDRYERGERSGGFGSGGGGYSSNYTEGGSSGYSGGGFSDSRGRGRGRGRSSDNYQSGYNSRGGYGSTYSGEEPDYVSPYSGGQDRF